MRKETKGSVELDRRRLLKGAGFAIGAAAATTAVASGEAAACEDSTPQQQAGYRESEDVKKYYKLARF
jgi:hypothetical protein